MIMTLYGTRQDAVNEVLLIGHVRQVVLVREGEYYQFLFGSKYLEKPRVGRYGLISDTPLPSDMVKFARASCVYGTRVTHKFAYYRAVGAPIPNKRYFDNVAIITMEAI